MWKESKGNQKEWGWRWRGSCRERPGSLSALAFGPFADSRQLGVQPHYPQAWVMAAGVGPVSVWRCLVPSSPRLSLKKTTCQCRFDSDSLYLHHHSQSGSTSLAPEVITLQRGMGIWYEAWFSLLTSFFKWNWLCDLFIEIIHPGSSVVKNLPVIQETQVWSLGWEDPLEKEIATDSSILAWEIPWTEEPGGLQSMGLQRVRYALATNQQQQLKVYIHVARINRSFFF